MVINKIDSSLNGTQVNNVDDQKITLLDVSEMKAVSH